ncbi:MAG: DUF3160 domain-containing protein [Planctomycetes bacterium]|nr:DUF3160 domain-containing protein [Planctomycetota bacterium]
MFELYEAAYPFVTSDVAFHTFMILMRATFSELESLVLAPRVGELSRRLAVACGDQARRLGDARLVSAARSNAAFFAVPAALIAGVDPGSLGLPADLEKKVRDELAQIRAHAAIAHSALFDRDEDFTKYLPRGRHASTPELEGYFQGMLYLGRMMFQLASNDETRRAILMVAAIDEKPELRSEWTAIDALVGQLFGERDDLALPDYEEAARQVVRGASPKDFERIASDDTLRLALVAALRKRPAPRIDTLGMETSGGRQRSAGLRVFGQRYSRPIDLFQQYLEHGRWPPSGLHVAAELFGSKRARDILRGSGFAEGSSVFVVPALASDPFASLMDGTIECARTLFQLESGAPAFMRKPAWEEKQINSALGGWAEVQHATALYTKDANLYLSASGMLDRFHGYVEPVPRFYSSLSALLARIVSQSDACGLFDRIAKDKGATIAKLGPSPTRESLKPGEAPDYRAETQRSEAKIRLARRDLEEFATILEHLESLATRELRGEPQTIDDGFFLKGLHQRLMVLSFNRSGTNVAQTSMAVITDVASEYQSSQCLEVGVARPWLIYAAVPDDGRALVCKGAVYAYTEFTQPIRERLDDGRWREMSTNLAESKHLPWIATRPDLGFVWTLTRAEVEALRQLTDYDGSGPSSAVEPWRALDVADGASSFRRAIVARVDRDLLLSLADQSPLNLGVRGFVLERLADFGDDPRVQQCFTSQVDAVTAKTGRLTNLDHCLLYFSIRGLGSCGKSALPFLEKAERQTSKFAPQLRDAYQAALQDARETIAANPNGRSRKP